MKRVLPFFLFIVLLSLSCNKNKVGSFVSPVIDPTYTYDNRSAGASARDILSSDVYQSIVLEIVYAKKHRLPDSSLDDAVAFLNKYCSKPKGIRVREYEVPIQGGGLTINNLTSIENRLRNNYSDTSFGRSELAIYVFVSEGAFEKKEMLGLAYRNTSIALFDEQIDQHSDDPGQPSRRKLVTTLLKHELGQLLGLVNRGTPMQTNHEDPSHEKYSNNPDCLMYHTFETVEGIQKLGTSFVAELDENCEADLRNNGGLR